MSPGEKFSVPLWSVGSVRSVCGSFVRIGLPPSSSMVGRKEGREGRREENETLAPSLPRDGDDDEVFKAWRDLLICAACATNDDDHDHVHDDEARRRQWRGVIHGGIFDTVFELRLDRSCYWGIRFMVHRIMVQSAYWFNFFPVPFYSTA